MDYERYSYSNNQYPNDYNSYSQQSSGVNQSSQTSPPSGVNQSSQTSQPSGVNQSSQTSQPSGVNQSSQTSQPSGVNQATQSGQAVASGQPIQNAQASTQSYVNSSDYVNSATQARQGEYTSRGTQASQSDYTSCGTQTSQSEYTSRGTQASQSDYANRGTQASQSDYANRGTQTSQGDFSSRETYANVGNESGSVYRMVNTNRVDRSYIPQEPPKKEKKSGGLWKKALLAVGLGVFFGISAGVAFYFVNLATGVSDLTKANEGTVIEEVAPPNSESDSVADGGENVSESGIDTTSTQTVTTVVTDVTEVVENVMPAVVSITNIYTETTSFWGQNFSSEAQSSGSGIIVNENENELLIVTNYHVVQDADTLKVQFINETVADAQVKGADSNMDLAVIAVPLEDLDADTKNAISLAKLGDSDSLKVGEPAIAIGNALGYGQSVTTGVISALDRQIEISEDGSTTGKLIQTDAAINPGNSGGALLNVKGEVIGINSNKIGGSTIEGMGYAIPISSAEPIIENLMLRETKNKVDETKKGYLGISGINVTSDVASLYGMPQGVYVTQVYEGTAAADAGLLNGDIITGFEGSSVGSMEDLQGYLEYYEIGETVEVTIMRTSKGTYEEMKLNVVLGEAVKSEPEMRR